MSIDGRSHIINVEDDGTARTCLNVVDDLFDMFAHHRQDAGDSVARGERGLAAEAVQPRVIFLNCALDQGRG